jgi:hypothetical protein
MLHYKNIFHFSTFFIIENIFQFIGIIIYSIYQKINKNDKFKLGNLFNDFLLIFANKSIKQLLY